MGSSERPDIGGSTALEISQRHIDGFGPMNLGLAQEFLHAPNNPQIITAVWRSLLPDVNVPQCKWNEEDIAKPIPGIRGETYRGIIVPDILDFEGPEGLLRMVKRFSLIDPANYDRLKSVVSYGKPNHCVKIEASIHAPNQNSTEDEFAAFLAENGITGITEQVYVLGGLFTKQMLNFYFDQLGTISDLEGSHDTARKAAIHAFFDDNGRVQTSSPKQALDQRQKYLGRRTMQVLHEA